MLFGQCDEGSPNSSNPNMEYYICKKHRGYQQSYTNRLVPNLLHRRQHCFYRGVTPQMQQLAVTRRNNPGALPTYQTCDESRFLLPERYGYLNLHTFLRVMCSSYIYICVYTTFECCSQHKTQQNTQESNR